MSNISTELESEYRRVEELIREKHKDFFDRLEQELLEEWSAVWAENGHDVSNVSVQVSSRIIVSLADKEGEIDQVEPSG